MKALEPLMLNFHESTMRMSDEERRNLIKLYAHELSDIEPPLLAYTVKALINDESLKWLPKIGEIKGKSRIVQKDVEEQARIERQIALHPEWYIYQPVIVDQQPGALVPSNRTLHSFVDSLAQIRSIQ